MGGLPHVPTDSQPDHAPQPLTLAVLQANALLPRLLYFFGIAKRKGHLHVPQLPFLDETQRPVNRLEIKSPVRVSRPLVRALEEELGLRFS